MSTHSSAPFPKRLRAGPYPIALLLTLCLPHAARAQAEPSPTETDVAGGEALPATAPPQRGPGAPASTREPRATAEEGEAPAHRTKQPARRKGKPRIAGVLNVNRASEAELRLLPGIGKGRAAQIVQRRSQHEFRSLEDLSRLRGLRKLVQRLRSHLTVSGDSTLRPVVP